MREVTFAIGVLLVAIIAGMAVGSVTRIIGDAWKGVDRDAFRALLGAFAGAFFAFLFVRFGDALKTVYERKEKHHTSLVRLQHYFNDCLNTTGDNLFISDDFLKIMTEARLAGGERPIFMNQFQQYGLDRELPIGLTNLAFTNEVYTINVELRKLNDSMAAVDRAYSQVREAFIAGKVDTATYFENVRLSRARFNEIKHFLHETQSDLTKAFATSNILLRDAPFLVRVIRKFVNSRYPRNFERLLQNEVTRVKAEIEQGAKASRVRIDQASARASQPSVAADAPQAPRR